MTTNPRLVVEDRFVPSQADWRESLFTTGNGYLITRGAFEEHRSGETRATFINGGFVTPPGELPLLGAVPDWTGLGFTVDGEPFDIQERRPSGYRRVLDTDSGVITRTVLWRGAHTGTVRVTFRRILPLDRPHLAALEVTFEALIGDVLVECQTGIDAGIPSPSVPVWVPERVAPDGSSGGTSSYHSIDGIHRLDLMWRVDTEIPLTYVQDEVHPRVRGVVSLREGERVTLTKYVSYRLERDGDIAVGLPPPGTDFEAVADSSRAAWAKRWQASTIAVDGDPEAELAFRFAAFQLIGAASPDDPGAGMGARIGGFGYRHHVFWDMDIFVAPYFAVCQPDLARAHLAYRYRGLGGARRKAARYGRAGAFYAWESAGTGDEVTPEWSNPLYGEPVRIWTGELQEHITADVAWSAHHYWRWTGDDGFLLDEGAEMIVEGARYWMSRLEHEPDGLHLRNVIGPDEYHIHVDDNFYTNLLAAWQLRLAPQVISRLDRIRSGSGVALLSSLGVSYEDLASFGEAADKTVLRGRADGVWEQHAGFFDLDMIDLTKFEPRLHSLYDLLGEERMQSTAVIKQPDVLMAMTLLPDESNRTGSGRANWEYYEPKADHGSSLSLSFHALLAAQMGEPDLGYSLFRRAAAIDLDDSMGNGAHGIHTACQGGLLMTALFGFAGLRLEDGEPITEPRLPDHWKSVGITFQHRGRAYDVEVSR
jgi:trehalose/maltose hydrolase-like predicted phosphorylase